MVIPTCVFIAMSLLKSEYRAWLRSIFYNSHFSYLSLALSLLTILLSSLALVGWVKFVQPDLSNKLPFIPDYSLPVLILLGLLFCLVNAVVEELIFRGIIWHLLLHQGLGLVVVFFLQSILFGLLHYSGFPSGLTGMALSGLYALALGYLRILTKGIFVPIVTHIFADLTIFCIVLILAGKIG